METVEKLCLLAEQIEKLRNGTVLQLEVQIQAYYSKIAVLPEEHCSWLDKRGCHRRRGMGDADRTAARHCQCC